MRWLALALAELLSLPTMERFSHVGHVEQIKGEIAYVLVLLFCLVMSICNCCPNSQQASVRRRILCFNHSNPMINKNWTKGRAREDPPHAPRAVDNVVGLRWGRYVGSPSLQEPKVVWRGRGAAEVAAFAALDNHEVFGLPGKAGLIVRYSQDAASSTMSPKAICGAGVVTFGHPDGVLRVTLRKSAVPQLFKAHAPSTLKVSVVAVGAEGDHVWLGFDSGKISALSHSFNPKDLTVKCGEETAMYAHSDRVTCIDVCDQFCIAASGSADGTLVLWDSKKLLFVRRLQFGGEVKFNLDNRRIPLSHSLGNLFDYR